MLASSVAACNLLAGLDEDYRYEADGATPQSESGDGDGASDGGDGSLPAVDAGDAGDATALAPRFCDSADAGPKDYCDDFEGMAAAPSFGWTSSERDVDAGMALESDAGMGHSHGLSVFLAQASTSNNTAWLVKKVGLQSADSFVKYELSFAFNILSVESVYSANLAMLTFPSSGQAEREFGIAQFGAGTNISKLGNASTTSSPVVFGTWQHATIVLERTPPTTTFTKTVTIDGATVVDTGAGIIAGTSQDTEIRIGIFSTAMGAGSLSVQFDNVLLRRW